MTADEELRRAAEWLVATHGDDVTIPRGSALWEDIDDLRAALAARSEPRAEGLREAVENHYPIPSTEMDDSAVMSCGYCDWDSYSKLAWPDHILRAALAATPPVEGLDRAQLEWFAWFVRKSKGTVAEVTARALEQNPYLRAPEQLDEEDYEAAMDLLARTDRPE